MALWGTSDADEAKPKYLTVAEKKQVYATAAGWLAEPGLSTGNPDAAPEVLACVGGLNVSLAAADITEIEFITTAIAAATAAALSVRVRFNEEVDVVTTGGTPQLTVTNDSAGTSTSVNIVLPYASGTGTNELVFTHIWSSGELLATDVVSVVANPLALNSGTIKDKGTATNSTITSLVAIGTAAGTITVS
jgi:hypothetical protein